MRIDIIECHQAHAHTPRRQPSLLPTCNELDELCKLSQMFKLTIIIVKYIIYNYVFTQYY